MKITILNKEHDETKYLIEDANPYIVNAIRRTILRDVPTLAIEDVIISKNDSALFDEIIAHRLGLIPLKTDLKSYNFRNSCKCGGKGCARCEVKFTLKAKGPGYVYSKDLISSDPQIKPVFDNIPITYLDEGQELELEAKAILGTGKEHAKWAPGLSFYSYFPKIKILKPNMDISKSCPKNVFSFENGKLKIKNLHNCDLCLNCISNNNNVVSVEGDPTKFIFTIESWGQLDNDTILKEALKILKDKLKELKKGLGK